MISVKSEQNEQVADIIYSLLHDQTPVYSPLNSTFIEMFENLKTKKRNRNVQKCFAVIIDN